MNSSERIAQHVIEHALPGSRVVYREDQSARTHDFDLTYADGRSAAVEVTAAANAAVIETEEAILSPKRGGPFVRRRVAKLDWYVNATVGADVRKIRKCVDAYLAEIEAAGVREFFAPLGGELRPAVVRIWRELGIEAGSVVKWKTPGVIGIAVPGGGGWITPEHVQRAVRDEAAKADNRAKLAAATGSAERHLFVVVDDSNALPWIALQDLRTGPLPPLPPEVTHAWVCADYGDALVVLHGAASGGGWARQPVPPFPRATRR